MLFDRINPMTGEVASQAAAMTAEDIPAMAARAEAAFHAWKQTGPNARRALLMEAAHQIELRTEAFAEAMQAEIGATREFALTNVRLAAATVREAGAITTQIQGEVIPSDKPGCLAMALREPVGVLVGMAPWNAPIVLGVRAICVPLACGNTVILKASESCPRTHGLIAEAFAAAGFPDDVVNLVTHSAQDGPEVVCALIDAPEVKRINFTGSTHVGRIIARRAAEHLKPCVLELGGKAPLLVLEDADIDHAVRAAAFGAFTNSGQICMSTERIIVVDAVADEFTRKFAEKARNLSTTAPGEGGALGPVIGMPTVERVNRLIDDALSKGASLLCGGTAEGILMPATAIDGVTPAMGLYRDETFGPVVAIIRARDEADAVRIANDTQYGLSASVFTQDTARGLRIARQINSGICHVNGPTIHDEPQMPFGGLGASGYGRFGGKAGIESFTELRWITLESGPGHYPI